jgi:RNA polymerase sigma-70 factor (ECF subfamily)
LPDFLKHTFDTSAEKQQAFMLLYEPVHARLDRFVQTLVWNTHDVKDVVSETVLVAFEKFDTLREPDRFLYYLFGIASRLVKKKQRRKKFFGLFSDEYAETIPADHNAEDLLLKKELHQALGKLNETQREAIVLFEISGFSIKEISVMQEMSESGVKSNLKRGREKLAKLLTEKQPGKERTTDNEIQFSIERRQYGE